MGECVRPLCAERKWAGWRDGSSKRASGDGRMASRVRNARASNILAYQQTPASRTPRPTHPRLASLPTPNITRLSRPHPVFTSSTCKRIESGARRRLRRRDEIGRATVRRLSVPRRVPQCAHRHVPQAGAGRSGIAALCRLFRSSSMQQWIATAGPNPNTALLTFTCTRAAAERENSEAVLSVITPPPSSLSLPAPGSLSTWRCPLQHPRQARA